MVEMNYEEGMRYLTEVATYGSVLGLEAISELLIRLGNPQNKLKFVHIGGTNGKGSTAAYLASILAEAGYKVGRFVSPVVEIYEECIQVSSNQFETGTVYIERDKIAKHLTVIREKCSDMKVEGFSHPTIFEIETCMAMLEFVEQKCDLVILEVGLGGRLDATNVIQTVECSVLTSISRDHMQFLGDSIEQIATEKAGIIKEGIPVVSYPQKERAMQVIREVCARQHSILSMVTMDEVRILESTLKGTRFQVAGKMEYSISLVGEHQVWNALVARRVCEVLCERGYVIEEEAIKRGLAKTRWFGRLTVLREHPYILVDGAHNPDAARQLVHALQRYFVGQRGILVVGVLADKEYEEILTITAPFAKEIITVTPDNPRALSSCNLAACARKYCEVVIDAVTVENGIHMALNRAQEEEFVLCFGSLSFLGTVKAVLSK